MGTVAVLWLLSGYSYNLFHTFADSLTIVIAACAFVVVWNSRRNVDNNYFTYVGISLLFFAFLDLIHMLGNKNMGVFPGYGNLGPTFYIASRYLLSISLLVAPFFINRKLNTALVFAVYSLATALILLSVFSWKVFPECFIEGVGLTPFKVVSDYIICAILLGAALLLFANRQSFDVRVRRILVASIILSIATGLTFTLYTDPFGVTNLVGHLFQIGSFYLIYVAIIQTSITRPQEILFRRLQQSKEALSESQSRLEAVFEAIPDVIVEYDTSRMVVRANQAALRIAPFNAMEFTRDEAVSMLRLRSLDDDPVLPENLPTSRALRGEVVRAEPYLITVYGDVRVISAYAAPIYKSGKVDGVVGLWHDITELKRTEGELRKSRDELELRVAERTAELARAAENLKAERQRLFNVLETLPLILALLRPDHRVEWANKAYRDAFGDNVGLLCYTAQFDCNGPCEECQAFLPLTTGRPHNWEWTLPDGRTFDIYNFPFSDIDGSPMILVMDIDITEQRRAEEEKSSLEAQLRQAQKMEALGTLAGGIGHDFNNILAAIIGFGELLRDHLPAEARERRYIERVVQAGMRGRELVRQMLTFSRQAEQEKKPLRLSSIVKETAKLLRASIPVTISIRTTVISESGVILGDPVQIQQVVMNLATNAAHAMQEKGGILDMELSDFSVGKTNGNADGIAPGLYMKLVVRDTGAGIAPATMDRIFDPFFTTKKPGEGTGLGLSVVMGIVKQSGGYITAMSEPGKGSTFTVYFPKIEEAPRAEEAGDETVPTGEETILFVDDEEALVEMGEELLAELGYEVVCRTNSREALALFRLDPSRFDLVITDQTMPEMTGVEMAGEMMRIRPGIPVILATGFSHLVDADRAREAGIRAFAMKPLTKKEIARTVRKVLDEGKK